MCHYLANIIDWAKHGELTRGHPNFELLLGIHQNRLLCRIWNGCDDLDRAIVSDTVPEIHLK